jgi:hydrogenase maturation factor
MLQVDRIEESKWAVVLDDNMKPVDVDICLIDGEVKSGTIIVPTGNGRYKVDEEATEKSRQEFKEFLEKHKDIWEKRA